MKPLIFTALAFTALTSFAHAEGAAIAVAPNRIVMDPKTRAAEASILNNSDKVLRYSITLSDQVMGASGTTTTQPTFAYSAKEMVRYMPKVVTLEPGKRQTIRIAAQRPDGLADGDYHTHMMFQEVVGKPEVSPTAVKDGNTFSMAIGMSYSIGIPLVVQSGVVSSSSELVGAALARNAAGEVNGLTLHMRRSGNAGTETRIKATVAGKNIIEPRNVRIYREVDEVKVFVPLLADVSGSTLRDVKVEQFAFADTRTTTPLRAVEAR